MKKFTALVCAFAAAAVCTAMLAGCNTEKSDKPEIVCTVFAEYDWVRAVLGEHEEDFEIELLQDSGADMHSYQPTVADIAAISASELFIYVGGESDSWVEGALASAGKVRTISLLEAIGDRALDEELGEGMQDDHDHDHDHEDEAADEHVWLSLINAQIAVDRIAEELGRIDGENAADYAANAASYKNKLAALDERYREMIADAEYDTILFGDRFPFLYMVEDYGLNYYAAFSGCSADAEASFETIAFLSKKMDELGLPAILTIEGSAVSIAETIKSNTAAKDCKILTLNSLQSVTAADVEGGLSYLDVMESNLYVLAEALGGEA